MLKRKLLGYCAVDSGQIVIVDPCYLSEWKDGEAFPEFPNILANHYATCCALTTKNKNQGGEILVSGVGGTGVVASSGLGDGSYPVYANYTNIGTKSKPDIRIKSLTIEFLAQEELETFKKL